MTFNWKTDVDCSEYTCKPRKGWVIDISEMNESSAWGDIIAWGWTIFNEGMAVARGTQDTLDESMWEAQGRYLELTT